MPAQVVRHAVDEEASSTTFEDLSARSHKPIFASLFSKRCQLHPLRVLVCLAIVLVVAVICVQRKRHEEDLKREKANKYRNDILEEQRQNQRILEAFKANLSHATTTVEQARDAGNQLKQFLHTASWKDVDLSRYDDLVKKMEQNVPLAVTEGHTGEVRLQQQFYHGLANLPFVKVVCEIGFNGGHSSANWLSAKPGLKLFSFDLGIHTYTRPRAQFLQSTFPGQIFITYGDSSVTLPEFHRANPEVKCDILVVDGDHTATGALVDLENMRYLANQYSHVLVIDDINCAGGGLHEARIRQPSVPGHCLGAEEALLTQASYGQLRILEMVNTDLGRGFGAGQYIFS